MSTSVKGTQNGETIVTVRNGSGDNYGTAAEIRNPDSSQIHVWGEAGDDTIEIAFNDITVFSKGHHVRGDQKRFSGGLFADTFVFTDLHEVSNGAVITGRIEDFDPSRDTLRIGTDEIDLFAGQGVAGGYAWKLVHYDSNPADDADSEQPFLVIDAGDGFVFYAMEGARVTMDNSVGAEEAAQEDHFVRALNLPADPWALPVVAYVDPVNFVPAGYVAQGGVTINDYDDDPADVLAIIAGSANGDLIAAGLNDDHVQALWGNDVVWGGVGNDTIEGDVGFDLLYGGPGHDLLQGGDQADNLYGDDGDDVLHGEHGFDRLFGGDGADLAFGGASGDALFGEGGDDTLHGGEGDDRLFGGHGNDELAGDRGADFLSAGSGFDRIDGGPGDDLLRGDLNWDVFIFADGHGQDTIADFEALNHFERIDLSALSEIDGYADLVGEIRQVGANVVIETDDGSSITLLDVSLADLNSDDFIF